MITQTQYCKAGLNNKYPISPGKALIVTAEQSHIPLYAYLSLDHLLQEFITHPYLPYWQLISFHMNLNNMLANHKGKDQKV